MNADRLVKRHALQLLETELRQSDIDYALVTETRFTSKHLNQYVAIEGYNVFRRDRPRRDGGGMLEIALIALL